MNFFGLVWHNRFVELFVGGNRRRQVIAGPRLGIERLEDRIVLSVIGPIDTETPQPIPIGNVKAGQVVQLNINYTTTDPQDQFEGEPLILVGSNGYTQVVSAYGKQDISFPISEDGETLSAYVQGADGDEGATIAVSSAMAKIFINDTVASSDNITLLNPASTGFPFVQTIPARLINNSSTTETFQLQVNQAGSGDVTLSQGTVSLAAGASTEITITPTSDSTAANDVHIIVSNDGTQVAEDDMTVASVLVPKSIFNQDSPVQMVSGGFYRIPPRVATPEQVIVAPNLDGSGQSVTLTVAGQSAADGTVTLDGNGAENLSGPAHINLTGGVQTTPGNAAKLNLAVQVRGQNTIASDGFSVAAIPQNYTETFAGAITQADFGDGNGTVAARGLSVQDGWASDSGVLADLNQVQLAEVVQVSPGTGAYVSPGRDQNSSYLPATQFTTDTHANPLAGLTGAVAAHGTSGTQQSLQVNEFQDARTGAGNVPVANSGYEITRTIYNAAGIVYVTTTKAGASVTAGGISSAAGAGSATVTQVLENLPPGDPLVVTTPPPATVTAGQGFGLVVMVELGNGSVNSAFNGPVTVASDSGLSLGGSKTVNAVKGIATFSGLTETGAATDALDVTAAGLPEITSQSFTVVAAPATHLSFLVPPTSGLIAASPFGVDVAAEDAFGNVDGSFSGSVTIGFGSNPGGATLGGVVTANAGNGIAAFLNVSISNAGNGYVMSAMAGGLTATTSTPFNVIDQLVVTTEPPSNVTIAAPFSLSVTAENALGHVDTSFSAPITLTNDDGNPLSGTVTVMAGGGVANFTGLRLTTAGTDSLTASSPGLVSASTTTFTVAVGKAVMVDIEGPNGTGPGNVISTPFALDVDALDINGNIDPTFNGPITLSLENNPGNSTLGGNLTVLAVNGQASFTGLTINNLGNGYTLGATSPGLSADVSAPFDVIEQAVVTTQPPASIAAGAPFGLIISADAGLNHLDTAYSGNITLSLSNYGSNNGTVLGTLTVPAINGVATFSGLKFPQAGSYGLIVTGTGLAPSATNEIVVTSSAAAQLVITTAPSAVTAGAGFDVSVAAEDAEGNVDANFTGNVTLALPFNSAGGALGGTITKTAVAGVASFTGLTIATPGTGYTLQATATGLAPALSGNFNVTPAGVANQLVITAQPPASVIAGSSLSALTFSVEDGFGTVIASFNGSVTLALASNPGGAILFGATTVSAVNGVATFNGLTLEQAAAGYTLSATCGSFSPVTTSDFTVTAAAASQLVMNGPEGNVLTGGPFKLDVIAEDPFGNLDTNFTGNVVLSLANNPSAATLGGTLNVAASGGIASFSGLTLNKAGAGFTLKATHAGLSAGASSPFDVTADQLVVSTQPPASVAANAPFGLVAQTVDSSGNPDPSFNGSVTLSLVDFGSDSATLGGTLTVTAMNGQATFSGITISTAGNFALSLAAPGVGGNSSNPLVVTPVATQLAVVSQPPATTTAGTAFQVSIAAEDSSGNVDTAFNGSITLSLAARPGAGVLGGTVTVTAVNGIASFTGLTVTQPGDGYTLNAAGGGLTATTTNAIDVTSPGVATRLVVTMQPPQSGVAGNGAVIVTTDPPTFTNTGSSITIAIAAEDGAGNIATTFKGSIALALDLFSAGPSSLLIGGPLTMTAANGIATFSGLYVTSAGSFAISASAVGLPDVASNSFTITPQTAARFLVTPAGGNLLTGAPFGVTVTAEDPLGNVDPSFTGSVTLALLSNPGNSLLGGTLSATAVNGVASFTGITINNPDSGYVLRANDDGPVTGVSPPFTVTNDQLVITSQPPAKISPHSAFGLVVAAENGTDAIDTSFNGTVTLALPANSNDTLGGNVAVRVVNGIASFSGLTLDQPGYETLTATSNGLAPATTSLVNVAPIGSVLAVKVAPPAAVTVGAAFELDIAAEDAFGNIDTSFNGSVSLSLSSNPGSATLGGTLTVSAVNGVASFPGLTLSGTGTGYAVQAIAGGLTAITTNAINVTPVGIATHLVITSQPPANVTAGAGFGLIVKAEDSFGAVDATFTGPVTIANPSGSTPGGTLTVTAVKGVATFAGLTLLQAGDCLLTVTSNNLPALTANLITVTGAPATTLAIVGPDQNVFPGSPFDLTVLAVDSNGNLDPTFTGPITLDLSNNPGGGFLGGTLSALASNGMATFTGLTMTNAALGYALQASSNNLTGTMPFDVTNDQLTLTTPPPDNIPAGSVFTVGVSATNSSGAVDTSFNGPVTVTLINDATNGGTSNALGGTMTVNAVNGVATFNGLTVSQTGTYSLSLAGSGLGGTGTNTFEVTAPVPAPSVAVPTLGRVVLPATVVVGAHFNVRVPVVITNTGAALQGRFTLNLYADLNTSPDGNQVLLASLRPHFSLKEGKSRAFNFILHSFPKSLQKGTYHLLVEIVDPGGATNLIAAPHTVQLAAPTVILNVGSQSVVPSTIALNKSGSIAIAVTNTGNSTASGVLTLTLSPSSDGVTPMPGITLATISRHVVIGVHRTAIFRLHFKVTSASPVGTFFPYVSVSLDGVTKTAVGTKQFALG